MERSSIWTCVCSNEREILRMHYAWIEMQGYSLLHIVYTAIYKYMFQFFYVQHIQPLSREKKRRKKGLNCRNNAINYLYIVCTKTPTFISSPCRSSFCYLITLPISSVNPFSIIWVCVGPTVNNVKSIFKQTTSFRRDSKKRWKDKTKTLKGCQRKPSSKTKEKS